MLLSPEAEGIDVEGIDHDSVPMDTETMINLKKKTEAVKQHEAHRTGGPELNGFDYYRGSQY